MQRSFSIMESLEMDSSKVEQKLRGMKFSATQIRAFFRLRRKYKISLEDLHRNMPLFLKYFHNTSRWRPVINLQLKRIQNRVFLNYNALQKTYFRISEYKKDQKCRRLRRQWSKRLLSYLKRHNTVEFYEDEPILEARTQVFCNDTVHQKLKEQLELLRTRKRVPQVEIFQSESQIEAQKNEMRQVVERKLIFNGASMENEENLSSCRAALQARALEVPSSSTAPTPPTDKVNDAKSGNQSSSKFIDILISKVKSNTDLEAFLDAKGLQTAKPSRVDHFERENSNSSSDFLGFDDNDRLPGSMLTPIVRKSTPNSVFESEALNAYMRDNSLEKKSKNDFPLQNFYVGLMTDLSVPPRLDMPVLPDELQTLRTVAERRSFFQKTKNVKHVMVNNIGIICRELQKRSKGDRINRHAVASLQASTTPMTRQAWKAANWLLTSNGHYWFQTMAVDGKNYRLYGGRGNSQQKTKKPHSSYCKDSDESTCPDNCIDRINFRSFKPIRVIEKRVKLNNSTQRAYKPCPLSQKILNTHPDDVPVFGSLEVLRMPQVELEVFPRLRLPLHDVAKRYLQLVLPYQEISRKWAEFAVSTLVSPGKDAKLTTPGQCFTFPIPYANDQNHVLVRRVYSRSEAFETEFENSDLSFRKEIDEKKAKGDPVDQLEEDCANILTDMINSVAISCSENSLIKDDPDNIYQHKWNYINTSPIPIAKKRPGPNQFHVGYQNKKQSRLLMELKRLNATIIDAAATKSEEGSATCDKESCKLGCVCVSLNEGTTIRQHCGKQRCILSCNCKFPNIMRLETDRTLTNDDVFMLRRQATARLARMEKDFTSTIVLTGSETLLINESQYDKKRRCTKIPKRYGDYVDTEDSNPIENKSALKRIDNIPAANPTPILVSEQDLQTIKHCQVHLRKLRDVDDIAPWCLVHMIYNCFCNGQAVLGNPIEFQKQEDLKNPLLTDDTLFRQRTVLSFDKETPKQSVEARNNTAVKSEERPKETLKELILKKPKGRGRPKLEKRGRIADNELLDMYLDPTLLTCRRAIAIPRGTFLRRNRRRAAHVHLYIAENETEETTAKLRKVVQRSIEHHKLGKRKHSQNQSKQLEKSTDRCELSPGSIEEDPLVETEVTNSQDDKTKCLLKKHQLKRSYVEQGSSLLRINHYKKRKMDNHVTKEQSPVVPTTSPVPKEVANPPEATNILSTISEAAPKQTIQRNAQTNLEGKIHLEKAAPFADCEPIHHSGSFQNVFRNVIQNMNGMVSKKMNDIDIALKRESIVIAAPNKDILCLIRWYNFVKAFAEGYIFLWEVQTREMVFIAATINNVMPLVFNALSVVNVLAIPKENLPLIAKMLIDQVQDAATEDLAVVLQGQKRFWFVKGFLRQDKRRACPKPTPESHPMLTKKINMLCRLLINQHCNKQKKNQTVVQQDLPQPSSSFTNSEFIIQPTTETSRQVNSAQQAKLKVLPMQRNVSHQGALILLQMIRQSYGFIRSNIGFRKMTKRDESEVFPPIDYNRDHSWFILDIANDFSHVFIPELKDLLPLDRIQKVISYAFTKKRIVKMQFSEISSFNAYVTPISKRKLYFGPFQNSKCVINLVLFQSVDGEMMLREDYETKHNVTDKKDKTSVFWVTRKRGNVAQKTNTNNIERQSSNDSQNLLNDNVFNVIPENFLSKEMLNDFVTMQNRHSVAPAKPVDPLEDDDCVIIEDDSPVKVKSNQDGKTRSNFTITANNSSVIVIPNETDITKADHSKKSSDQENHTFSEGFSELTVANANSLLEGKIVPPNILVKRKGQKLKSTKVFSSPNKACAELQAQPGLPVAPAPIQGILSTASAEISSPEASTALSSSISPNKATIKTVKKIVPESSSNTSKSNANSIKFNKNITITKVLVDNENNESTNKSFLSNSNSGPLKTYEKTSFGTIVTKLPRKSVPDILHSPVSADAAPLPKKSRIVTINNGSQIQKSIQSLIPPSATDSNTNRDLQSAAMQDKIRIPSNTSCQKYVSAKQSPGVLPNSIKIRPVVLSKTKEQIITCQPPNNIAQKQLNETTMPTNQLNIISPEVLKTHGIKRYKVVDGITLKQHIPKLNTHNVSTITSQPPPQHEKASNIFVIPKEISYENSGLNRTLLKEQEPAQSSLLKKNNRQSSENISSLNKQTTASPSNASGNIKSMHTPKKDSPADVPQLMNKFAIKRNTGGSSILSRTLKIYPPMEKCTESPPSILSASPPQMKTSYNPTEVPCKRKISVMRTSNTTVITPLASCSKEKVAEPQDTNSPSLNFINIKKLIKNDTIKSPSNQLSEVKNTISVTPTSPHAFLAQKPNASDRISYFGYFQANQEGLPKFVVKRENDEFLIKTPKFNGIVKLTGLANVYNYLNEFCIKKCGIPAVKLKGIKWLFKLQNSVPKTSTTDTLMPPINNTSEVKVQKTRLINNLRKVQPDPALVSKPTVSPSQQCDPETSIVVLDDD